MLHHLPDPAVLWNEIKRLGKGGAAVYVMDLHRPDSLENARQIVESRAAKEHPILQEDFYSSLCAAFTREEIEEQLCQAELSLDVLKVSERHILIKGILPCK
jgi:SAM-dependent methyltransferase